MFLVAIVIGAFSFSAYVPKYGSSASARDSLNTYLTYLAPDIKASSHMYTWVYGRLGDLQPYIENSAFSKEFQGIVFDWLSPILLLAWDTKTDSAKAADQFRVWKMKQYLAHYSYENEQTRVNDTLHEFTQTDWNGRTDPDGQWYARIHRRIRYWAKTGNGCSLWDMKDLVNKISNLATNHSTATSTQICNTYISLYSQNKLVYISEEYPDITNIMPIK